jgi:hypothetical protein
VRACVPIIVCYVETLTMRRPRPELGCCVTGKTWQLKKSHKFIYLPIPVAARSKEWACVHSLAEIMGSNPAGGMGVCLL